MMTNRDQELRQKAKETIKRYERLVERDPYRLVYHLMPPVGLLNDPNGFIDWDGTYHLFYQWHPFEAAHGPKFWGHFVSGDLVFWEEKEPALTPSDWFDKNGCYSGSAVADNGKLKLFYTGNVKNENDERESYQCVAESEDGLTFTKKGVILHVPDGYTAHFRDPKVWKRDGIWYLVIGAQTKQIDGHVLLFRSDDLKEWQFAGIVTGSNVRSMGDFGYMWECPDLFHLDGEDVLLVSPQGLEKQGYLYHNVHNTGYFIGRLDYETGELVHGPFKELDRGFEFYAPQTTIDRYGRRILFGWMGVPDQGEEKHPTVKHQWIHAMTLPRELKLVDGKIYQRPVEELKQLRKNEVSRPSVKISEHPQRFEEISGEAFELLLDVEENQAEVFELTIRDNVRVIFNRGLKRLTLERVSFVDGLTESRHCELAELSSLHLYVDTSAVELFVNEGEEVFTARYFADPANRSIQFKTLHGSLTASLKKWALDSIMKK
ncbi:glycoside hydrolase family 32 protein [Halalkalibacterium halodurans]|nr:glycoside hydrolase family 32 protein [Halalkalibacterium halodurans]MED4171789.1 glycoside hydrolase family 32 protein [Halalkalibacterium halodurans]